VGQFAETRRMNHEGHEDTRRKTLPGRKMKANKFAKVI
jgi:hypothetical protein